MPLACTAIITEASAADVERPERALVFTQVTKGACTEPACSDAMQSMLWQVTFTYDDGTATRVISLRDAGITVSEVTIQPGEAFCTPIVSGSPEPLHPALPTNNCDVPPFTMPTPAAPAPD